MLHRSIRITSILVGTYGALLGAAHGIHEVLQGATALQPGLILAIGDCRPEAVWHGCFPAFSILPNFLAAGSASLLFALAALLCVVAHRRRPLFVLIPLLFVSGGGFVPVYLLLVSGWAAKLSDCPLKFWARPHPVKTVLGRLWPVVAFFYPLWILLQIIIGNIDNQLLLSLAGPLFLGNQLLPLLLLASAMARDGSACG